MQLEVLYVPFLFFVCRRFLTDAACCCGSGGEKGGGGGGIAAAADGEVSLKFTGHATRHNTLADGAATASESSLFPKRGRHHTQTAWRNADAQFDRANTSFQKRFALDVDLGREVSVRGAKVSCRDEFTFSAPTLRSLLLGTEIGFIILPALTVTAGLTSVLRHQNKAPKKKEKENSQLLLPSVVVNVW
jgi:hypothetical protein